MTDLELTDATFKNLRDFIEKKCGIAVGDSKRYLIETRLSTLAKGVDCATFDEFHTKLVTSPNSNLADQVVDAMTTNETLWFRDQGPWSILNEKLLPECSGAVSRSEKNKIRIWCAAASTGQEPYSIAISILEHIRNSGADVKPDAFRIVGTDLSPSALYVGTSGRYDRLAIERGLAPELRERYFVENDDTWDVNSQVKEMVQFEQRNLMEPFDALGRFDLVFCRNVLIYFSADLKRDIVTRIGERIVPGGAFIVGASESLQGMMGIFKMKQVSGNFFYQRPTEGNQ